jgi:IS5 family transposase
VKQESSDVTFITADPGHTKADSLRGEEAKTRRSWDGMWTKKGQQSYFGYKLHSKVDTDLGLIRELETTTASVHDSQVDLAKEGEVVYRAKGYQGTEPEGYSATMRRDARDHPLGIRDTLRNIRISKKRAPAERHYAVIKIIFTAFEFNLYQLCTLRSQGIA